MHDIKFNIEDVRRFQAGTRAIGRDIARAQSDLKRAVDDVSAHWKDSEVLIAQKDVAEIERKLRLALTQLDKTVDTALRRQVEWANRYRSIR